MKNLRNQSIFACLFLLLFMPMRAEARFHRHHLRVATIWHLMEWTTTPFWTLKPSISSYQKT